MLTRRKFVQKMLAVHFKWSRWRSPAVSSKARWTSRSNSSDQEVTASGCFSCGLASPRVFYFIVINKRSHKRLFSSRPGGYTSDNLYFGAVLDQNSPLFSMGGSSFCWWVQTETKQCSYLWEICKKSHENLQTRTSWTPSSLQVYNISCSIYRTLTSVSILASSNY